MMPVRREVEPSRPTPTPHGSPTPRPSPTPPEINVYGKGIDEILLRIAIGSDGQSYAYYPQQNHEGSVTLLSDSSGNVLERYRYDAFGAPTIYDGSWNGQSNTMYDNRFLFTGREYAATYRSIYNTPAFNFYEYRARAYNPTLGRFMSEDPKLFDAGDYNLFRYCHNDPIDFTDPMGTLERYHATLAHSVDRLWEMTKWFDRSNILQGNFPGFGAMMSSQSDREAKGGFTMGPIGASRRSSASVEYTGFTIERKSPEDIASSTDPGVGPSTKSYTLPVVGKTRTTEDELTGSVSVMIPVSARTVLPNNTNRYDRAEADQRIRIISSVTEANRQVKDLASHSFKDVTSFQRAVEAKAHHVLWIENRRNIMGTDINNQW